jgi:hypothetical protein
MPPFYENYVWRLRADSLGIDIQLPQDLEWVDEFSWSPIQQTVETTLTGALVVQESKQLRGRPITLVGKDDMAWIDRVLCDQLSIMKNTAALVMVLDYVEYNVDNDTYGTVKFTYNVMFRHYEPPPLELESVLRFDNFETTSWFKVRNIKFMEALSSASSPCTANVTLEVSGISGSFGIGDVVSGDLSGTSGTVLSISGTTPLSLHLYVADGVFQVGETVRVDASNYATIDSIS